MPITKNRQIIPAMVRRHIEDAAFFWSQYDRSEESHLLHLSELTRFTDLIGAHLDGIEIAGRDSWPLVLAALKRWNKPGEAFVCTYSAACSGEPSDLDLMVEHLRACPEKLIRGAISALAWAPWQAAERAITRWTAPGSEPVVVVTALRALTLINNSIVSDPSSSDSATWLQAPLHVYLTSSDAHVRAAACRFAPLADDDEELRSSLKDALQDSDLAVRAQAAIALAQLEQNMSEFEPDEERRSQRLIRLCENTLRQCIYSQVSLLASATGWHAKQGNRRLNRWLTHLAGIIKPGQDHLPDILSSLPTRFALRFAAYHGDPANLPFIVKQMDNPETARYAGWVWQVITGIDIAEAGLILEEPASPPDSMLQGAPLDSDFDLSFPNGSAIACYPLSVQCGKRYLNGEPITLEATLDIIEGSSQPLRSIAVQHLQSLDSLFFLSIRAPASIQSRSTDTIKEIIHLESMA